jgi:hypothetical protein
LPKLNEADETLVRYILRGKVIMASLVAHIAREECRKLCEMRLAGLEEEYQSQLFSEVTDDELARSLGRFRSAGTNVYNRMHLEGLGVCSLSKRALTA